MLIKSNLYSLAFFTELRVENLEDVNNSSEGGVFSGSHVKKKKKHRNKLKTIHQIEVSPWASHQFLHARRVLCRAFLVTLAVLF